MEKRRLAERNAVGNDLMYVALPRKAVRRMRAPRQRDPVAVLYLFHRVSDRDDNSRGAVAADSRKLSRRAAAESDVCVTGEICSLRPAAYRRDCQLHKHLVPDRLTHLSGYKLRDVRSCKGYCCIFHRISSPAAPADEQVSVSLLFYHLTDGGAIYYTIKNR